MLSAKKQTTNAHLFFTVIALAFLVYLGKILYWPTEKDEAQKRIALFTRLASFQNFPSIVQTQSKHNAISVALADNFEVDISNYLEGNPNQIATEYTKSDLTSVLALYFRSITKIEVSSRNLKEVGKRTYQTIIVAQGKTYYESFNDAYLIEISFNNEWQVEKIKVFAPPSAENETASSSQS